MMVVEGFEYWGIGRRGLVDVRPVVPEMVTEGLDVEMGAVMLGG